MKTSFATSAAATPPPAVETSPSAVESPATAGQASATSEATSSPSVIQHTSSAVSVLPENVSLQVQGEVSLKDLKLPRVSLVAKTGVLCDTFTPGHFVVGKEVPIGDGKTPFKMVVLSIKKNYQENLKYGENEGQFPKVFDKASEVREAGGSLQWGDANHYREIATALVLVPCPADIPEELREQFFFYEVEGQHWALCLWTFAGGAYTSTGKKLITAGVLGHLKTGFARGVWEVTSELKKDAKNSWYTPVVKAAGATSPEFQTFVAELLAQGL